MGVLQRCITAIIAKFPWPAIPWSHSLSQVLSVKPTGSLKQNTDLINGILGRANWVALLTGSQMMSSCVSLIAAGVQVKICSLFPTGSFLFFFFFYSCHNFLRLLTCFLGSNSQLSFGILHSTPSMTYKSSVSTLQDPYCIASIWQYSNLHWKQQLQQEHANHKYHQLSKWVPVGEILQTMGAHLGHAAMQKAGGWSHKPGANGSNEILFY